jgi:hypothetical protein
LISTGTSTSNSHFLDASASGGDVFFLTGQALVGWDTDANYDIYDARIGGGVPEPVAAPLGCSGDTCRGPLAAAPSTGSPGSATLDGGGNATVPVVKKVAVKKPVVRKISRARRLSGALRLCEKRKGAQRKKCEARARRRFGRAASKSRGSK